MRLALPALALMMPVLAAAQDAPPPLPSADLPPPLDRILRDYERAWAGGDAAGLAALFTEDGFVLSSGAEPIRGRDAIRRKYANAGGSLRLRALGYATADTVGYIVGAYRYGDAAQDTGKFVLALRRGLDGRWLIAADIDNSIRHPWSPGHAALPPRGARANAIPGPSWQVAPASPAPIPHPALTRADEGVHRRPAVSRGCTRTATTGVPCPRPTG